MSLSMLLLLSRILIRPFRIFDFDSLYFVVLGKGNGNVIGVVQSIFNSNGGCSIHKGALHLYAVKSSAHT